MAKSSNYCSYLLSVVFSLPVYIYITISLMFCVLVYLYPLNEPVDYGKCDYLVFFPAENIATTT